MNKPFAHRLILKIVFITSMITATSSFYSGQDAHAVEPACPGGTNPDPNIIWCDDFNDGSWVDTWAVNAGWFPEFREAVRCDGNNFGYRDLCAAYSGILHYDLIRGYDNHLGDHVLPGEYGELYLRMYIFFSNPYVWGDVADKGIYLAHNREFIPRIRMEYSREGTGKPTVASYGFVLPDEIRVQNQGNDITFEPGKWYIIELYVKLNTPGVSDGIARLWVDEATDTLQAQTLRLEYTDLLIRNTGQTQGYNDVLLTDYHEVCNSLCPATILQWVKWDNIVVSKAKIGLPAGWPPPNPPTGLTVK
jgi:hypothetical protein